MSTSYRLSQLRAQLNTLNAHALLIPMSDRFQNEYLAPQDQYIKWLTGFAGSAGFCIVTQKNAALFSDGRYILQMKQQIDTTFFEPLANNALEDWVRQYIKKDDIVLYDPWLLTVHEVAQWTKKEKKIGFTLKPLDVNLIDDLWENKPVYDKFPAFLYGTLYTCRTFLEKKELILAYLTKHNLSHYLWGNSESLNWLLNLRGFDLDFTPLKNMYGILHLDGSLDVFTHLDKIPDCVMKTFFENVFFHDLMECEQMFHSFIAQGAIGYDPYKTPVQLINLIEAKDLLAPLDDPCLLPKATKTLKEQEGVRACHVRDGVALVNFLHWFYGQTNPLHELDLCDTLEAFRQQQSLFHSLSFTTICGFAEHGAIIHYNATPETNSLITGNNLLLLDSGGQYLDGTTDVTRTLAVGTPTPEHKACFTHVLKGHIALARAVFPKKTSGGQLDCLARQYLWENGQDYAHGTGHGVGHFMNLHEGPQGISPLSKHCPLEIGMLLSNEPGYYKEGAFGIRIESLMLVQAHPLFQNFLCFETVTLCPIDLSLVQVDMLTLKEVQWLNTYHQKVYQTLAPFLREEQRLWLQHATTMISL